ncbi:MAG TPA: TRAP transporter substrate-binding protein DctP [Candidatus Saccharimonadia bacterium]|nr:TRAP transporter substrate-binding protein DctP [Candidatus Saccharimonadia bacterium]
MFRALAVFAALLLATAATAAPLKIATVAPEGSGWMREMRAGAAAIRQRTDGRVELKFYPAGVMGNNAAVIRKIKLGQLHGAAFTGAEASAVYSDAPIYGLPFLFRDYAEIDHVRASVDPLLRAGFAAKGMVAAGISGGGFAYLMGTRPIRTHEELRDAKVWTPQSDRISEAAFEAGGVSAIPLPLTDVYPGLQTGLIDTVANTFAGAIFFQWHTKVKHVVDLPLTFVVGYLLLDDKALARVAEPDRAIVLEEVQGAFDRIDESSRRDNDAARATLVKLGVAFIAPTSVEAGRWREIGDKAERQLIAEGEFMPATVAAIRASLAALRAGQGKAR